MRYSAFSFFHNCISGGYPIREAIRAVKPYVSEIVAVDCESTDNTRDVLREEGCRIVEGKWGHRSEGVMEAAHILGQESCQYENLIHFEADEVWEDRLIKNVVQNEMSNCLVWRVQVEQNFQRIRWNPHQVHRVFKKGTARKNGQTTEEHDTVSTMMLFEAGLIYDVTYCFRDQWKARSEQNAKLWGEDANYRRRTPGHFLESPQCDDVNAFLAEPHWTWKTSPLHIPAILRPLIGVTKYV